MSNPTIFPAALALLLLVFVTALSASKREIESRYSYLRKPAKKNAPKGLENKKYSEAFGEFAAWALLIAIFLGMGL